ncbi:signal peptidase I [Bifidobacterium sp. ESL0790]|uniref:signal peptidase I n=1 Tax=Bifidobacterium sp. ESL0790 TaxID=2983233 RepID=UPI0023F91A17|nr:signal peptidase I [Bifidobacterium sp. ESL0790]WEV72431.1 signal peptidase I [Bifidobacterium sp. ESL0790]
MKSAAATKSKTAAKPANATKASSTSQSVAAAKSATTIANATPATAATTATATTTPATRRAARAAKAEETRRDIKSKLGAHVKEGGKLTFDDVLYILICCLIAIVIASVLRLFVFGLYAIPSGSMEDTLEVGDHIVTNRLSPKIFKLQRGDVVVFKDPANWLQSNDIYASNDLVKRVIGLPGDVVACKGAGYPVTVNGVAIDESSYIKDGVQPSGFSFKVKVTPGNIFVLGDNRANSADSRYHANDGNHGLVPLGRVKGVAMLDYWPASRFKVVKSHHDVFAKVPGAVHS